MGVPSCWLRWVKVPRVERGISQPHSGDGTGRICQQGSQKEKDGSAGISPHREREREDPKALVPKAVTHHKELKAPGAARAAHTPSHAQPHPKAHTAPDGLFGVPGGVIPPRDPQVPYLSILLRLCLLRSL